MKDRHFRSLAQRPAARSAAKVLLAVFLCLTLLTDPTVSARGLDLSPENCRTVRMRHGNILELATNRYTQDRPVIVFFPGGDESTDLRAVMNFIRFYELYDHLDADLVTAAFRSQPLKPSDWKGPAEDLLALLQEKADPLPPLIIDAVSISGYGACWLAKLLQENGTPALELNLADACIPRQITADWLRELAAGGTRVRLWGCEDRVNLSKETRALILELAGEENIQGTVVNAKHGAVLHTAIHEHGLHGEYAEGRRDSVSFYWLCGLKYGSI